MTGKDLLIAVGNISQKYYDEAENGIIGEAPTHRSLRRPLLIAAVIALAAVLVGCAVVYALRLQDMSIGQETYTQSFDDRGKAIEPVEKTRDILTLYGHSGDAIQSAMKEWYEFTESYDPDGELMDNNPDHPEIPNSFEWTYSCYTLEMAEKLQKIADKYDLKLLEEGILFQAWQGDIFLEETGIGSLTRLDSGAETSGIAGMYYPPQNFNMEFELAMDCFDVKIWGRVSYARKDYFPREFPGGEDLSQFDQWDYTAVDGTKLLLALSSKGKAYIIAQPESAMLVYSIDGNFSGSDYPAADEILTKEELERIADVFDYSIQPHEFDRAAVQEKLDAAEADYQAAHTYEPETYGSFSEYIKESYLYPQDDLQYTFYDLTGDGEDELLIGKNGAIREWITIRDGQAQSKFLGTCYLCEGGIMEECSEYEIFEIRMYYAPVSETVIDDLDAEPERIVHLERTKNQWRNSLIVDELGREKEITQEEVEAIINQYHRVTLDWKPFMDYPLSESQTLLEYLEEKDVRVSHDELLQIYKKNLTDREDMYYTHYRILDINADGVDDLLLKGEDDSFIGKTDFYWNAITYRYGKIWSLERDFYLCEDGVLECVDTRHAGGIGVEKEGHQFQRCVDLDKELYEFVVYNKATASWWGDWWDEVPVSEDEANAILAKYPRIDQGMRPISELLD